MAYMSQERKAAIAPVVKAICNKYKVKASMAVRNHMTLVLNIKQGEIDFMQSYKDAGSDRGSASDREIKHLQVNPYHFDNHFTGKAKAFLNEVFDAMQTGNHNRSDIQTDYFDVGWYVDVNIGQWDAAYALVK
jgi:hypothetical protein